MAFTNCYEKKTKKKNLLEHDDRRQTVVYVMAQDYKQV